MKKFFNISLFLAVLFVFVGCQRTPVVATFQNATMAGSDANTVKIIFSDDKHYEDKVYDVWIKSDKDNSVLKMHYENEQTFIVSVEQKDYWYSLTSLEYESKNMAGKEDFESFKQALNKTLIIESEQESTLTFKVIVGDKIKNADETGYLIANAEDVSKEYKQKLTPLKPEE